MAISVDPALERERPPRESLEAVAVSDFLNAWGAAEGKPQAAYRLPAGETDWTISTRPHEPRSTSDQILTLSYDVDHVDLVFEAQVTTTSGYLFQHSLTAPAGLKIEEVSLLEDDVERASRWSQEPDGRLTVFLNDAASGSQRFLLRGRLPIQAGKAWPLPQVRLEQCQLHSATIRLFRRRGVLLTIQGNRQPAAAEPPGDRAKSDTECFVEAISWDGSRALPVTVTVTPNRPKVRLQEIVTVQWNGRSWMARLDGRLSIHGGVVDQFEIHAPQPWNGPYQANLPGQLQARPSPGQVRRLLFRPQVPISGDLLLSITGPLGTGARRATERAGHPPAGDRSTGAMVHLAQPCPGPGLSLANARADAGRPAAPARVLRRFEGNGVQGFGQTGAGRFGAGRHAAGIRHCPAGRCHHDLVRRRQLLRRGGVRFGARRRRRMSLELAQGI